MAFEFLGRGFGFPLGRVGSAALVGGVEKVQQSIYLILSTSPGERVMRPDFGCGIHDLTFMPNTDSLRGMVQVQVTEALARWEPRIDVIGVTAISDPNAPNRLLVDVEYRLRSNNALYNQVYPLFLSEGVGLPDPLGGGST